MVLGAYLYGLETVGECLKDETGYLKPLHLGDRSNSGKYQTDIDFSERLF